MFLCPPLRALAKSEPKRQTVRVHLGIGWKEPALGPLEPLMTVCLAMTLTLGVWQVRPSDNTTTAKCDA